MSAFRDLRGHGKRENTKKMEKKKKEPPLILKEPKGLAKPFKTFDFLELT